MKKYVVNFSFIFCLLPLLAYAEGACNGAALEITAEQGDAIITITSVSYDKGYLSTTCDDTAHTSPPEWTGSGAVISANTTYTLYAHEEHGYASGTIYMTVSGSDGTQNISFDFSFNNEADIQCEVETPKVTSASGPYKYLCTVDGNYSKASCGGNPTASISVVDVNSSDC